MDRRPAAMAIAERIANATGKQVIFGVRPHDKGWYVHWDDWETDCNNIYNGVVSLRDEVRNRSRSALAAAKAAQDTAEQVLTAVSREEP